MYMVVTLYSLQCCDKSYEECVVNLYSLQCCDKSYEECVFTLYSLQCCDKSYDECVEELATNHPQDDIEDAIEYYRNITRRYVFYTITHCRKAISCFLIIGELLKTERGGVRLGQIRVTLSK